MTLERGWKARQEAAIKKAAMRDKMHELNRLRASVIGNPALTTTPILPTPAPAPAPVPEAPAAAVEFDEDQFDPSVDVAPTPTPTRGRKKA
jgi:hypothetical protein